jgi:hypothetical protein
LGKRKLWRADLAQSYLTATSQALSYDPTSPTTPCHGFTVGNGEEMFFFIEKRVMVENKLIYFFFSFDSSFFSLK